MIYHVMPNLDVAAASESPDPYLLACYPNAVGRPLPGLILEIRRERTVELVMEGLRQWDMLRWKEGLQMVNENASYYGMYVSAAAAVIPNTSV